MNSSLGLDFEFRDWSVGLHGSPMLPAQEDLIVLSAEHEIELIEHVTAQDAQFTLVSSDDGRILGVNSEYPALRIRERNCGRRFIAADFLIDTGADHTVFSSALYDRLGVDAFSSQVTSLVGIGGAVSAHLTTCRPRALQLV